MRIPSGDLAPARRRRRRPYGRRSRALPVTLVVLLLAAVGGGTYVLRPDRLMPGRLAAACPEADGGRGPAGAVQAAAEAPRSRAGLAASRATAVPAPGAVRFRVLNGTPRNGLGRTVAEALAARGFGIVSTGNAPGPVRGPARIAFGPGGRPGATLLAAHVMGAQLRPVPTAAPGSVELVLGDGFVRLRTPAEAAVQVTRAAAPLAPAARPAPRAKAGAEQAAGARRGSPAPRVAAPAPCAS